MTPFIWRAPLRSAASWFATTMEGGGAGGAGGEGGRGGGLGGAGGDGPTVTQPGTLGGQSAG